MSSKLKQIRLFSTAHKATMFYSGESLHKLQVNDYGISLYNYLSNKQRTIDELNAKFMAYTEDLSKADDNKIKAIEKEVEFVRKDM